MNKLRSKWTSSWLICGQEADQRTWVGCDRCSQARHAVTNTQQAGTEHPVQRVAAALKVCLRYGASAAQLAKICHQLPSELTAEDCASQSDGLALAEPYNIGARAADRITRAVKQLGEGPYGRAATALFGLSPDSRGRLLKDRRRLAASEFDLMVSTFRKYYEPDMLVELAYEIWCAQCKDASPTQGADEGRTLQQSHQSTERSSG